MRAQRLSAIGLDFDATLSTRRESILNYVPGSKWIFACWHIPINIAQIVQINDVFDHDIDCAH